MKNYLFALFAVAAASFTCVSANALPAAPQAFPQVEESTAQTVQWHSRYRSHHRWGSRGYYHGRYRSHHRWGSRGYSHGRYRSHHRWGSRHHW
jgi:hypothetical protein